jgi:hypothetical protein
VKRDTSQIAGSKVGKSSAVKQAGNPLSILNYYTRQIPAARKEIDESGFFKPTLPEMPSFAGNLGTTGTD